MRYVCLILSLIATGALAPDGAGSPASMPATQPATTRPAGEPTSWPHDDPRMKSLVRKLVAELGAPAYRVREGAQKKLDRLGERALPYLVEFIGGGDPEVASRIAALIKRPEDPHVRVEVAVRLLATADPDLMEPAVHMLFETPMVDCDLFVRRTAGARGIERAIFKPVAEQLHTWKRITELFHSRQLRLLREKRVEVAGKERKFHEGSRLYQAEAAYWSAVEAMGDYGSPKPAHKPPTTGPGGAQEGATLGTDRGPTSNGSPTVVEDVRKRRLEEEVLQQLTGLFVGPVHRTLNGWRHALERVIPAIQGHQRADAIEYIVQRDALSGPIQAKATARASV